MFDIEIQGRLPIGHLDHQSSQIQPLSFISGTRITNFYQVIEAGEASIVSARAEPLPLSSVKLLPTISGRDNLAVGKNYVEHAKEFNSSGFDSSDKIDQPTAPAGQKTPEDQAMDYVWGYTIINDLTARKRQRDHKQFYIGKSPDTYCPIGPVAVPEEQLPEKENIRLQTFVNGEKRQDATLDQLIFSHPESHTIATGTPYGVGFCFRPMKFLKAGDEVKVSVTGLGSLVNRMATLDAPNPTIERSKRLFYQFQGQKDGAPVIFIHGLGGSSSYFTPLNKLSTTHALHLTDLEGHGLSPTSALSSLTISSFAGDIRDVYTLAAGSNPKPAAVTAHSMGCLIARELALDNPHLVSNLVLHGPPPSPLPEAGSNGSFARAETVRAQGMAAVANAVVNAGLSSKTRSSSPLAVTATKLSLLGQDPEGYARRSAEETLNVEEVAAKTLILTGTADAVSPPALCEKYGQRIQGRNSGGLGGCRALAPF
ncbi:bifunctional fumarylacetoacetate hydrolase/alpha/beta hydrolase family protein [Aspergillus foveolatus]|uniref:bifunctional fumarylacetoacetate hydrolase/alpha/beta hydrolase family protein n=1 Tax=Aspergillus foveolatus TaxID=210207 RepID=UPI003CCCF5CB